MKYQKIVERMTLEQKAAFLSGKNEWESRNLNVEGLEIPSIFLADGPHGIRKQEGSGDHLGINDSSPATCFPTAATVANSWNEELCEEIGEALGEEAAVQGVDVLLGPGLNMKRSPLCGRNFEYFSEDPYHAGKLAAAYIRGIQRKGVYACPKHFAVNSQELRRMAMNAVLDERTLRESYLTAFEIAVKEGNAKAIMSSYNQVNGIYANENSHLLWDILRKEWEFDGFVVTDWGGSNSHVRGVQTGSNLEMPNPGLDSARQLIRAIKSGELGERELDANVDTFLGAVLDLKEKRKDRVHAFDPAAHHLLAKRAAAEGTVLLKNEENILPLKKHTRVAVIGEFAFTPRYQGAGSSMVHAIKVDSIVEKIPEYDLEVVGMAKGYRRDGKKDDASCKEAMDLAANADVVLYFFGLNEIGEAEGIDRNHMRIPQNQIDLLSALAQRNKNIVGIMSAGCAVEMPWHRYLKGILNGYLAGEAGAGALLDIITGKVNPSGRLNETYPLCYEDTPAFHYFPSKERNAEYRESVYIGYRYYDTNKVLVQYPFGFGLSYTEFRYSDLKVSKDGVNLVVTNIGTMDGAEVVQLYVGLPDAMVFRPKRELKGFSKVFLKAGESKEVTIPFDDKTFRYFNVKTNGWEIETGTYLIQIGASVSDIRLSGEISVTGTTTQYPYNPLALSHYYTGDVPSVSNIEFEALLGHPIPEGKWSGKLEMNDAICQMYYAKSALARFLFKQLDRRKKKSEAEGKHNLNIHFIYNMPFRALSKMTAGAISLEMVEGIMSVVNGHFFQGIGKIVVGFFKNRKENKRYKRMLE